MYKTTRAGIDTHFLDTMVIAGLREHPWRAVARLYDQTDAPVACMDLTVKFISPRNETYLLGVR